VKHLSVAWIYDLPAGGGIVKATPLLVNGVLYFANPDHAYAVEARTGRELWHYTWERNRGGMHIGNRGVAIFGESLFFLTPDCNLVSLDIKTGQEKWFKEVCSAEMMYFGSVAPVVVKDRLIVGVRGDDLISRRFSMRAVRDRRLDLAMVCDAPDKGRSGLETWPSLGEAWRRHDPAAGDLRSSAESSTSRRAIRSRSSPTQEGANLFTPIVALNADTGKMYFRRLRTTRMTDATQRRSCSTA
jgi:alcohol dehydrogenase (cytochrome c)